MIGETMITSTSKPEGPSCYYLLKLYTKEEDVHVLAEQIATTWSLHGKIESLKGVFFHKQVELFINAIAEPMMYRGQRKMKLRELLDEDHPTFEYSAKEVMNEPNRLGTRCRYLESSDCSRFPQTSTQEWKPRVHTIPGMVTYKRFTKSIPRWMVIISRRASNRWTTRCFVVWHGSWWRTHPHRLEKSGRSSIIRYTPSRTRFLWTPRIRYLQLHLRYPYDALYVAAITVCVPPFEQIQCRHNRCMLSTMSPIHGHASSQRSTNRNRP